MVLELSGGAVRILWGPDNGLTVPVPAVNLLLCGGEMQRRDHKNVTDGDCLTACVSQKTSREKIKTPVAPFPHNNDDDDVCAIPLNSHRLKTHSF